MITNKWIAGNGEWEDAKKLRREVFIEEQNVAEEQEFDDLDLQSLHLVVYDGDTPIATGRIWHDGKTFRIGRCCVTKSERGGGIGDLLLKLLLIKTFEYNPSEVRIHAQTYAVPFYERYGFACEGEEYMEENIPHKTMSVTKETLVIPSKCGKDKHFEDFFTAVPQDG
ncbi:GNAT family N-acetyltransferase [Christensenellaceae bacterium OttesenSCG-928-K19]|nr:GNAT family N-acetyltransferase [Christensenellaceae bacterium OttesenSCG-928-K19]